LTFEIKLYELLRVIIDIMQIYFDAFKRQCKSYLQDLKKVQEDFMKVLLPISDVNHMSVITSWSF
jgi:hypothetical protein